MVTTPGEAFDAPGFLRISYANSLERLQEATTRIAAFVETLEAETRSARTGAPAVRTDAEPAL